MLDQCDIYGNEKAGIFIITSGNPTVRNCKIHDGKNFGVAIAQNGSGTFENCELRGNKKGAWYIESGCQVTRRNNLE